MTLVGRQAKLCGVWIVSVACDRPILDPLHSFVDDE
jgi:hypothetical protein